MYKRLISILLSLSVLISLIVFIHSGLNIHAALQELEQSKPQTDVQKRIILIAQELDTPYWKLLEQGAREQAEVYDYLLQYIGPIRNNAQEQQRLLQKAIAAKPDGIIVQGLTEYEELIAKAAEQNITVVTVDIDAPKSPRIAYVGTDNLAAGEQLAELVKQRVQSDAQLGIIIGSEQADNQLARLNAFRSALSSSPQIQIIDKRSSNISRLQAAKMTIEMLKEHPQINVIVGLSGLDAIGIVDGLDAIGKEDVLVFGFDNLANTEALIAEGRIVGSIVQQPFIIGKQAIDVLYSEFNDLSYQAKTYVPTTVLSARQSEETP